MPNKKSIKGSRKVSKKSSKKQSKNSYKGKKVSKKQSKRDNLSSSEDMESLLNSEINENRFPGLQQQYPGMQQQFQGMQGAPFSPSQIDPMMIQQLAPHQQDNNNMQGLMTPTQMANGLQNFNFQAADITQRNELMAPMTPNQMPVSNQMPVNNQMPVSNQMPAVQMPQLPVMNNVTDITPQMGYMNINQPEMGQTVQVPQQMPITNQEPVMNNQPNINGLLNFV